MKWICNYSPGSRDKDHCKDVNVVAVIITRVGVMCNEVLGRSRGRGNVIARVGQQSTVDVVVVVTMLL